jgi:quercetin dioxygenase-like cupin family protein
MLLVCGLLIASPAQGQEIGLMTFAEGEVQHVVRLDDTPWAPCPPSLPEGCEMAVLDGNPQGEDLFTVRFRIPAGALFVMPPHWHPKDERVTVISGTVAVAFGVETTRDDATEFGPGDYYVNARHAVHSVWIDGGTILQITGIGPWEAIPIEQRPPPR